MHGKCVVGEGSPQCLFEVHSVDGRGVHRGFEHAVAALSLSFRLIHRGVRMAEEPICLDVLTVSQGDANAGSDRNAAVPKPERGEQCIEHPLGDQSSLVRSVEIVNQDRELVTAETRDRVEIAQVRVETVSDCDQECVTGKVAEAVVHVLEAVEVNHHHRDVSTDPHSSAEGMFEPVVEQCPVRQTGERVVRRLVADLVQGTRPHDRRQQDPGDPFDELLVFGFWRTVGPDLDMSKRTLGITDGNP